MKGITPIALILTGFITGLTLRHLDYTLTSRELPKTQSETTPKNINLPRFTVTQTTPYSSYVPEANIFVEPLPEGNYISGKVRNRKLTQKALECPANQC